MALELTNDGTIHFHHQDFLRKARAPEVHKVVAVLLRTKYRPFIKRINFDPVEGYYTQTRCAIDAGNRDGFIEAYETMLRILQNRKDTTHEPIKTQFINRYIEETTWSALVG